jgi:monoamine oxidase
MSRSPLFRVLHRAASLARASLHRADPLDELIQRAAEHRVNRARRRWLQGAASGAGALALAACRPAPLRLARAVDEEVVVVGAGIAGLTAAWRLRQAGVPVRVIEPASRVGGRMFSLRNHFSDGQVIELGGELIDSDHVRIRALAQELGLTLDDLAADDPSLHGDVWFAQGRS